MLNRKGARWWLILALLNLIPTNRVWAVTNEDYALAQEYSKRTGDVIPNKSDLGHAAPDSKVSQDARLQREWLAAHPASTQSSLPSSAVSSSPGQAPLNRPDLLQVHTTDTVVTGDLVSLSDLKKSGVLLGVESELNAAGELVFTGRIPSDCQKEISISSEGDFSNNKIILSIVATNGIESLKTCLKKNKSEPVSINSLIDPISSNWDNDMSIVVASNSGSDALTDSSGTSVKVISKAEAEMSLWAWQLANCTGDNQNTLEDQLKQLSIAEEAAKKLNDAGFFESDEDFKTALSEIKDKRTDFQRQAVLKFKDDFNNLDPSDTSYERKLNKLHSDLKKFAAKNKGDVSNDVAELYHYMAENNLAGFEGMSPKDFADAVKRARSDILTARKLSGLNKETKAVLGNAGDEINLKQMSYYAGQGVAGSQIFNNLAAYTKSQLDLSFYTAGCHLLNSQYSAGASANGSFTPNSRCSFINSARNDMQSVAQYQSSVINYQRAKAQKDQEDIQRQKIADLNQQAVALANNSTQSRFPTGQFQNNGQLPNSIGSSQYNNLQLPAPPTLSADSSLAMNSALSGALR